MVNIKGIIGERPKDAKPEDIYTDLPDVIEQVQNEPNDEIHVLIDSIGGDVDKGISIYEYLRGLNKKVTTESVNNCASIAAIIFLAGETRIAGCPIMIHNPYIDNISGDQKTLEMAAKWIGEAEKQYEKICSERTRLTAETLSTLMDNETYISPSQAVSFGFATQSKIIAIAKLNNSNINKNAKTMSTGKKSLRELLGLKPKAKAMQLTTADGSTLTVNSESGNPQVGDEASPDGSFTMEDGSVITVADGKIAEITQASAEGTDLSTAEAEEVVSIIEEVIQENEDLKKENEDLKEQVASAKAMIKSEDEVAMLNAIAKAGGREWFAKQCSHYKPQARIGGKGKNEIQKQESKISAKLAEIKEKRGIN